MIWPTAGQASRISFVIVVWMERTLRVSPVPRLPHYGGVAFELRTPLCELLGIAYPVLSVGFDAGARAELVAAVSNAGGFGVLGASELPPGALRAEIERTRTLTDSPFAINLTDFDEDHEFVRLQISTAAEAGATAVVLFWGDPAPFVAQAHAAGVFVLIQVGSVEEAESAVDAGVDAVIVQGVEAGGHVRGTESIWNLLPASVEAVRAVPVLASGGIGDGAGLARAIRLGAQCVSLGTRFVASDEANIHAEYKRRIVSSDATDTVLTADLFDLNWPGAPHRTIRNRTHAEWTAAGQPPSGQRPGEGTAIGRLQLAPGEIIEWPRYAVGMATSDFDGDIDYAPLWAGESCSTIGDIKPAAQIIQDLIRDAQAALDDDTNRVTNESREHRRPKGRVKSVAESAGSGAFEGEARADGSE